MSLQTDHSKKQVGQPSLGRLVPQIILISSTIFWLCITVLITISSAALPVLGWGLVAFLAVCSTFLILYLGKSSLRKLQSELKLLANLARRDNTDETVDLAYAEFSEIAAEIDESNRTIRDEMEGLRLAAYRDATTGLPNRLSFMAEMKKGLQEATEDKRCAVFHLITNGYQLSLIHI